MLLAFLVEVKSQIVNINCDFIFSTALNLYTCDIRNGPVIDNENANFVIGGQHLPGWNDAAVRRIQIVQTGIRFIIPQLAETFPNTEEYYIRFSQLNRIAPNAFANAPNLRRLEIMNNFQLEAINANAFVGIPNLDYLDLLGNQIATVHETAFNGLTSLRLLFLDLNRIKTFPVNVFRSLTNIEAIWLAGNDLQSLDGRLMANNPRMIGISLQNNHILSIQRNFLDNFPVLEFFDTQGNVCSSNSWTIGGSITIDTVREGLAFCFDNFWEVPEDQTRKFNLGLSGSLVLRHKNGTEIIRT